MTETCQKVGCPRKPTHYVELAVPCVDDGPNIPKMRLTFGLKLCRDHVEACEVDHVLTPSGREKVEASLKQMRRGLPDFQRAKINPRRIGDKHWQRLHEGRS